MQSLPAYQDDGDCMSYRNDEMGLLDASPFTIRKFVSAVRGRDISKCWPFRQRILERCLKNGIKPQLPPFNPPPENQLCCQEEMWQEPIFANGLCEHAISKATESATEGSLEESHRHELVTNERSRVMRPTDDAPRKCQASAAQLEEKKSEDEWPEIVDESHQAGMVAVVGGASGRFCDRKEKKTDEDIEPGAAITNPGLPHAYHLDVIKDLVDNGANSSTNLESLSFKSEGIAAVMKDQKAPTSDLPDSKSDDIQVVPVDSGIHCDCAAKIVEQQCTIKCRWCSEHSPVQDHDLEPPGSATCTKPSQDESLLALSTKLHTADSPATNEHELMGEPNKLETGKNGDDFEVTGMISDPLVPQVCPVCLNFNSTSNTALNAHIDHCLATVLPTEKTHARLHGTRIKARKMRSMVEICAVAPARTLEDVELSSQCWVLKEHSSRENVSRSQEWKDGAVRRQPRTPLKRGTAGAWKRHSKLEGESKRYLTLPSLEKQYPAVKMASRSAKPMISSSPSMDNSSNVDCQFQGFSNDQECYEEATCLTRPLKSAHATSAKHAAMMDRGEQNKPVQNLESVRDVEGSRSEEDASVNVPMYGHLGKLHTSQSRSKGLSQKCAHHKSAAGSCPSQCSPKKLIEHCYHHTKNVLDELSNHPSEQFELAASINNVSLDPALTQSCHSSQCYNQDNGAVGTKKRKRKRNGMSKVVSVQRIHEIQEHACSLDQEMADYSWLGTSADRRSINPVDTSLDKTHRLLLDPGCAMDFPQVPELEAEILEQQSSLKYFPSGSKNRNDKDSRVAEVSKLVVASVGNQHIKTSSADRRGISKASKKRKLTQMDQDWGLETGAIHGLNKIVDSETQIVDSETHIEMCAGKENNVTNAQIILNMEFLEDKNSDQMLQTLHGELGIKKGACVDEWEKVPSNEEFCLKTASSSGFSNCQAKIFVTTKGNALGIAEHIKTHCSSSNRELVYLTQQRKSSSASSVALNGPSAELMLQGRVRYDCTDAAHLEGEMPHSAFAKESAFRNMTDELRLPTTSMLSIPDSLSKNQLEGGNANGSVKQTRNQEVNMNKDERDQTHQYEANKANLTQNGAGSYTNIFEATKKARSNAYHGETVRSSSALAVASMPNTAVNKSLLCTSSGCIPIASISGLASITDICAGGADAQHKIHSSFINQEALGLNELSYFQPVDSIRTTPVSDRCNADVDAPDCTVPADRLNSCLSSAVPSCALLDNCELSASTSLVGLINSDYHIIATSSKKDRLAISNVETPMKGGTSQISPVETDLCDKNVVVSNDLQKRQESATMLHRRELYSANRSAINLATEINETQNLIPVAHAGLSASNQTIVSQNASDFLGPGFSVSHSGTMIETLKSPALSCQANGKLVQDVGVLDPAQRLDRTGNRNAVFHRFSMEDPVNIHCRENNFTISELKELQNVHQQMKGMPYRETARAYTTEMGKVSTHPQILQSKMQIMNGSTPTIPAENVTLMSNSFIGSGKPLKLSSNQPICQQFSSLEMNERHGYSLGGESSSRMNGYGGVGYPGEQGVVHIFGNPVFKLMGKNVMVSNKDDKSWGLENPVMENAKQGIHTANSAQYLECRAARDAGLLEETHGRLLQPPVEGPVFPSQEIICSSQLGAWEGDSFLKLRNHSLTRNDQDIYSHALQNLPLHTFCHAEHSGFIDPAVPKAPVSMENLSTYSLSVGTEQKKQSVMNFVKTHTEAFVVDSLPSSGTLRPAIMHRSGCRVTQKNGKLWSASKSLNARQMQSQAPTLHSKQDHIISTDSFPDLYKLGLSACSGFVGTNPQSGTLSDIVHSSDRSTERLWKTLPGSMEQSQFRQL